MHCVLKLTSWRQKNKWVDRLKNYLHQMNSIWKLCSSEIGTGPERDIVSFSWFIYCSLKSHQKKNHSEILEAAQETENKWQLQVLSSNEPKLEMYGSNRCHSFVVYKSWLYKVLTLFNKPTLPQFVHENEEGGPKCRHEQAGRNSFSGLLKCKLKLTGGKLGQQGSRQQEWNNKSKQPSMMWQKNKG